MHLLLCYRSASEVIAFCKEGASELKGQFFPEQLNLIQQDLYLLCQISLGLSWR